MGNVLLIEPDYNNKYPPLGLMKISTYHKLKGDNVVFYKGKSKELKLRDWDRIYVTTLFTFYWSKTVDTIKFYYNSVSNPSDIYTGGVLATILENELRNEVGIEGITIKSQLLDKPGMLGEDNIVVDHLPPDYSIIDTKSNKLLNYIYPTSNSYIAYSTRGCIRTCPFCAVPNLEPEYKNYISLKDQVEYIKNNFGEKKNLLLLDNNVLASPNFDRIINDIIELGFGKDAKYTYVNKSGRKSTVNRYVDFNQGIDARLLDEEKMRLLSKIAINPLRIAFDDAKEESIKRYKDKVLLAAKYGIKTLSNYILFNFTDTPQELYLRLKINIDLNSEFNKNNQNTVIWSFPMKYSPLRGPHSRDRKHVGKHWNKKLLRGIQCILNSTHGVVGPKKEFFETAFGKDDKEFIEILLMPEEYIMYRNSNKVNGKFKEWKDSFDNLGAKKETFIDIIKENNFRELKKKFLYYDNDIRNMLKHYISIEEPYTQQEFLTQVIGK